MANEKNDKDIENQMQDDMAAADQAPVEEWQGELPPEDDFHDEGDFSQDIQEEIVEESLSADAYDDAPASQGKRGKGLLYGALAVGLAFMGGIAYLQFGQGGKSDSMTALMPVSSVMSVKDLNKAAPQAVAPGASAETSSATTTDMSRIYSEGRAASTAATMAALPSKEQASLVTEKPIEAVTTDMLTSTSPAPAPVPDTKKEVPSAAVTVAEAALPPPALEVKPAAPQVAKVETIPAAPMAALQAANKAEAEQNEKRIKGLNDQIEGLKKSLDEAAQKNTALMAQIESLQQQMKLEKDRSAALAAAAATAAKKVSAPVVPAVIEKPVPAAPKDEPVVEAAQKKTPVVRSAPTPKKPAAPKESGWVLRAATPDSAWLSKGAEAPELRRVFPGETVPGLGKIKEIRQNGDQWEVVGTRGTVK